MNWKNLVSDLISAGYTQAQIAKSIGITQPTVAGILSGLQKDMRWTTGEKLLRLHKRAMRKQRSTEPAAA